MMIETERLILRPPALQDADDFFDIFSDATTCRDDGGYDPYPANDDSFQKDFAVIAADAVNRLFIVEKNSGKMIGVLHLMDAPDAREIGYVIHRDFRRRGYASEAVSAVVEILKENGAPKVRCTAYQFNTASQRMLEKLGFVSVGVIEKKNSEWNERVYELKL